MSGPIEEATDKREERGANGTDLATGETLGKDPGNLSGDFPGATGPTPQPSVTLCYHFYHPETVVSAQLFTGLAEGLAARGWRVRVLTGDQPFRQGGERRPRHEVINGVAVHRVHRPGFNQSNDLGRMVNAFWIMAAWLAVIRRAPKPDFFVIGTDPQFSALMFPSLKWIAPDARLVHWALDLFPEAVISDAYPGWLKWLSERFKGVMRRCYARVDLMADLGSCMRARLDAYQHPAQRATLTPWALVEPAAQSPIDPVERQRVFGDARLAILYAGGLARAHDHRPLLGLARRVRELDDGIVFAFTAGGNRFHELETAVRPDDVNVRFTPFVSGQEKLEALLGCADMHLISLRPSFKGVSVPSKFFGSIATGRPILYSGPADSSTARIIREADVGLVLTGENLEETAQALVALSHRPERLARWRDNAFNLYRQRFSQQITIDAFDRLMRAQALTGRSSQKK